MPYLQTDGVWFSGLGKTPPMPIARSGSTAMKMPAQTGVSKQQVITKTSPIKSSPKIVNKFAQTSKQPPVAVAQSPTTTTSAPAPALPAPALQPQSPAAAPSLPAGSQFAPAVPQTQIPVIDPVVQAGGRAYVRDQYMPDSYRQDNPYTWRPPESNTESGITTAALAVAVAIPIMYFLLRKT